MDFSAGAQAGAGGWLLGLGKLFARFNSEIKFRGSSRTSIVDEIRKRPGDLIAQVNRVLECVEEALSMKGKRLLIVAEDLDKLNIADARNVFIENGKLLADVQAKIIYTVPIFLFHSPDASAMKAMFDHDVSQPMIKVLNPGSGGPYPDCDLAPGFETVKKIVLCRVAVDAITADALELLIRKTGGVLRHVFQVLQTAANMTTLRELPIKSEHITYGLRRLKNELALQIALPTDKKIDGLDRVDQLYDELERRVNLLRGRKPSPVSSEPIVQVLLKSCALVEYNGERWLGVHPLVIEYLKDLGRLKDV
jgi:hypothetical protein